MNLKSKFKNESGQLADILMFFVFIVFVIYFLVLFTSMQLFFRTQKIVDSEVRDEVEVIRTKGILTTSEYQNFLSKLAKHGSFNVYVSAEKQDNAGVKAKWFDINTILDKPFKVGDFIKIYVETKKPSLFAELLNRNFMFMNNSKDSSSWFKMQSVASGMICSDGFIRGIEVVNMINKYAYVTPAVNISLYTLNYSGAAAGESPTSLVATPTDYTARTYNSDIAEKSPGWVDYEGRYSMDVEVNSSTYQITKIIFKELLSDNLIKQ